jgi:hypothetical protein
VTFSPGASELIDIEQPDTDDSGDLPEPPARYKRGVTVDDLKEAASDPAKSVGDHLEGGPKGWSLDGIGTIDEEGESHHDIENSGVPYVQINGSEHIDPPNQQPPDRPKVKTSDTSLTDY